MSNLAEQAGRNLAQVRAEKPLIHNITNYVVMNLTANALLAMGASPVMAHAQNEVEEMASMARALVLNIGTLSDGWIQSMLQAGKMASKLKIPIVLDPVGAGATRLRTRTALEIIEQTQLTAIRGNGSEILALSRDDSQTKGVDSVHSVGKAAETAKWLARELNTTLAITGPADLVTNGQRTVRVANGHPLMGAITGTGCAATVTCAAFLAVDPDPVSGVATALAFFGLAGEMAGKRAAAPGSFQVELLDRLYRITPEELEEGARFEAC